MFFWHLRILGNLSKKLEIRRFSTRSYNGPEVLSGLKHDYCDSRSLFWEHNENLVPGWHRPYEVHDLGNTARSSHSSMPWQLFQTVHRGLGPKCLLVNPQSKGTRQHGSYFVVSGMTWVSVVGEMKMLILIGPSQNRLGDTNLEICIWQDKIMGRHFFWEIHFVWWRRNKYKTSE